MLIALIIVPIGEQLVDAEISAESSPVAVSNWESLAALDTPPQRALSSAWHCPGGRTIASPTPHISFCKRRKARTDVPPLHMQQGFNQTLALMVKFKFKNDPGKSWSP